MGASPSHQAAPAAARLPMSFPLKLGPRAGLSNERNFVLWFHVSCTGAFLSIALLATSTDDREFYLGAGLLAVSTCFALHATHTFFKRQTLLVQRSSGPYGNGGAVVLLGLTLSAVVLAALVHEGMQLWAVADREQHT
mmetsp:Transcript_7144/g.24045  ORF Transcript_7144/g.24045 Transcript_7144/m.24045 type:complete len:138 (-) Transcript_7144:82-495(-)